MLNDSVLTGKQRGALRAMANDIEAIFQVGKGGINDNMLRQIDDALEARELIKLTVLKTAEYSAREACDEICGRTNAQPVQTIGNRFVIYRRSRKQPKIEL